MSCIIYKLTHWEISCKDVTGYFNVEVFGASQVQVTIYSLLDTVVASYGGSGHDRYHFTGTLPSGNSYYATVTTENGSQTMRLVVK